MQNFCIIKLKAWFGNFFYSELEVFAEETLQESWESINKKQPHHFIGILSHTNKIRLWSHSKHILKANFEEESPKVPKTYKDLQFISTSKDLFFNVLPHVGQSCHLYQRLTFVSLSCRL